MYATYWSGRIHPHAETSPPVGDELADAPVPISNGITALTTTGVFARRDGARDIAGSDVAALRAPECPTGGRSSPYTPSNDESPLRRGLSFAPHLALSPFR